MRPTISQEHIWATKTLLASFTGLALGGVLWMIQRRVVEFWKARTLDWVMVGQFVLMLGLIPLVTWFLEIELKTPAEAFTLSRYLVQVGAGLILSATGLVIWALAERRRSRARPSRTAP